MHDGSNEPTGSGLMLKDDALSQALLDAHASKDHAKLISMYTSAADIAEEQNDIDAACFYLTHAFVFALESGAAEASILNKRLADKGRAKRLTF